MLFLYSEHLPKLYYLQLKNEVPPDFNDMQQQSDDEGANQVAPTRESLKAVRTLKEFET